LTAETDPEADRGADRAKMHFARGRDFPYASPEELIPFRIREDTRMKIKLFLLTVLLLVFTARGYAAQGAYASVGGGLLKFDDGFDTVKPKQVVLRIGYNFNEYIGLGYEGGFSLIKDELYNVDFDVKTTFLYLKGSFPISETSFVYLLAGPTNVKLTGSDRGVSVSSDDDDTGTGVGFETRLNTARLFVDYITYYDKDGVDVHSLNIGAAFYF